MENMHTDFRVKISNRKETPHVSSIVPMDGKVQEIDQLLY